MVIGTGKTNIGDLVGSPLYGVIWSALNTLCPSDGEENFGCKYNGYYVPFNVRWLSNDPNRSRNKLPDAWPQDKGSYLLAITSPLRTLIAILKASETFNSKAPVGRLSPDDVS
jgi:hypothetical protein